MLAQTGVLKVRSLNVLSQSFSPQGEVGVWSSLPIVWHWAVGGVKARVSLPFLLMLMWVFSHLRYV